LCNIYSSGELNKCSVVAFFATTAADGKTYNVEYFNLDAIISSGYRINSLRGTQFCIWATNVLYKHLMKGCTINEKRIKAQKDKIRNLQETVRLLGNVVLPKDPSDEARGIIQIISEYSRALNMLYDFDHQRLVAPKGTRKTKYKLTYAEAKKIIDQMKIKLKNSVLGG